MKQAKIVVILEAMDRLRFEYRQSKLKTKIDMLKARLDMEPRNQETNHPLLEEPTTEWSYSLAPAIRNRVLFIHIPKCAGISVNHALYGCLGIGHQSFDRVRPLIPRELINEMHTFTILRDPVERFVSAFYFIRSGGLNGEFGAGHRLEKYRDINDFIERGREWRGVSYLHFIPQTCFLNPLGMGSRISRFYMYENIEDVWRDLGIIRPKEKNKTAPKESIVSLKESSVNILRGFYHRDYTFIEKLQSHC